MVCLWLSHGNRDTWNQEPETDGGWRLRARLDGQSFDLQGGSAGRVQGARKPGLYAIVHVGNGDLPIGK